MNRRNKLYLNTSTALLNQVVTLICGFILPRYILSYFGSEVNGLMSSITQFLGVISLLELGIGPVIQSNLYEPLVKNDKTTISKIIVSAEKFYRKIAYIFLAYIAILIPIYSILQSTFDFWFTASLMVIIAISTFSQYYFGITYQVFLSADQKVYVTTSLQIITTILNTLLCVILIRLNCNVHIVKLVSSIVFVVRPLVQNIYVRKKYDIDRKIKYTEEPIKQKWNGFAQHLATVITTNIGIIALTLFASYQIVSIYSVYLLVVNGMTNLVLNSVSGLEAFWGDMIAKKENQLLLKTYKSVECIVHAGVTLLYVAMAILIAPFISVYTKGLSDHTAYYLPLFGSLLTFAYAAQCLRIPYFRIIKAAGHYKETQNGSFIAMALSIILSVALVFKYQLVGIAIAMLAALLYNTVYYAWYLRKNILNRPIKHILLHLGVDIIVGILGFIATSWLEMKDTTYATWIIYAIIVTLIVGGICVVFNFAIYRKEFLYLIKKVLKKA